MTQTLFVANRGEPVARARRTADRRAFSLAGAVARDELQCGWPRLLDKLQVFEASRALYQQPADLAETALRLGAGAVWPAWGFLSENPEFARQVEARGMTWVGPSPHVLTLFGDKIAARKAALAAGLPVLEQLTVESADDVPKILAWMPRFPLLLKGAYGGGGKGQLIVRTHDELARGVETALRQNQELFGAATLLVEPYLERPRHVEVQVLADRSGRALLLGTRDCSSQRRFQKVIEEAPAPGIKLPPEIESGLRRLIEEAAYVTAGTVEFLVEEDRFCFLEVNPRLQVEHSVTEETVRVKGKHLDLLEWMVATARGETLPFEQHDIECVGHSMEARIYAEDIHHDCLPRTGLLDGVRWPEGAGLRVDAALKGRGEPLLPRYDSMLGKVIATAADRTQAIARLDDALAATSLTGVPTNLALLRGILANVDFRGAELDTGLLSRVQPVLTARRDELELAAAIMAYEQTRGGLAASDHPDRATTLGSLSIRLCHCGDTRRLEVAKEGPDSYWISGTGTVTALFADPWTLVLDVGPQGSGYYDCRVEEGEIAVYCGNEELRVEWAAGDRGRATDPHLPPTGGVLCRCLVPVGRQVSAGTPLYILESMKMETTVTARWPARVVKWLAQEGDMVERGQGLLELSRDEREEADRTAVLPGPVEPRACPDAPRAAMAILGYDLSLEEARTLPSRPNDEDGSALRAAQHMLLLEEAFRRHIEASLPLLVGTGQAALADASTNSLLARLATAYGVADKTEFCTRDDLFGRFYHARRTIAARREIFFLLLAATATWDDELGAVVADWYPLLPTPRETKLRDRLLKLISQRAPGCYYNLRKPPVAREYWKDWQATLAPQASLPPAGGDPFELANLPRREWIIDRWFKQFTCVPLFMQRIPEADLYFLEARRGSEPVRLIALAQVHSFTPDSPYTVLPELERAAIVCYKLVRRLERVGYQPNHVFLSVDDDCVVPWGDAGEAVERCASVAARIGGYASGLRIDATESFLNLGEGTRLLVVRHAPDVGIVSSPPFPMDQRRCEDDPERWLDSRQQRMGKLTNQERLQLIFDRGEYAAVALPDAVGSRLDVCQGLVAGIPAVVYANDFRRQGGALGEAEGRRLTLAVLYAYFTGKAAIALHDGAGANVRESATSLVWAGAYFGAVAATSGRASPEDFARWWAGHVLQGEMAAGLQAAGITDYSPRGPLRHFHLHVGAAVGMLVYGPSIAGISIMLDHPNAYRVLTGSRTVAVTLGEKLSNHELGGAMVHARCSGDVDLTVEGEPRVFDLVRSLLPALSQQEPAAAPRKIHSNWQCTREAAILFPRQALQEVHDPEFFVELRPDLESAGSITTVLSRLAGRPVVTAALGAAVPLASRNAWRKLYHAARTAADWHIPLILAFGGRPIPAKLAPRALEEKREFLRILADLTVPVVAVAFGPEALQSPLVDRTDCTVLLDLPGADSVGLDCHRRVERFDAAFQEAARLLELLHARNEPRSGSKAAAPPVLPEKPGATYDIREFVQGIVDDASFLEFWPDNRVSIVCGLAFIGGHGVAVIADDPEVQGGAQTRSSLARFTRFNRLVERWRMPLIQFNDSPAFMPGSRQERAGIQGAGGKSLLEEVLTEVPRIAVTLRQSYGGRLIHANLRSLGPPRTGLALFGARLGVMGSAGAATVLYKGDAADLDAWKADYEAEYLAAESAQAAGAVDQLCDLADLREHLVHWRHSIGPRSRS